MEPHIPFTINRTEVSGVPTLWSPSPGPLTAALMFRVGTTDEVLAASGITHLVEHLALHGLHDSRYQMNAFVDLRRTVFHCRGSIDEVRDHLRGVCRGLMHLPLDRVEHERRVLEAESSRRPMTVADSLANVRYGAAGLGASWYREFGLLWLDGDTVQDWARTYFTRGNAVLWLSGPVPEGLTLDLWDGQRHVQPDAPMPPFATPAWYHGMGGVAALSMVSERSRASSAGAAMVDRRIQQHIRHDLGVSYAPGCSSLPVSSDTTHIVAAADGSPENMPAIRDGLLAVVDALADQGPSERELADHLRDAQRWMEEPSAALGLLDSAATSELTGDEYVTPEEVIDGIRALRVEDVASVISEARRTMLVSLPPEVPAPDGFAVVPPFSEVRFEGTEHKAAAGPLERRPARSLIVAADGISMTLAAGTSSAGFDDTVALLRFADGGRALIARDGTALSIRPEQWKNGAEVVAGVDAAIPLSRQVPMPADAKTPSAADADYRQQQPMLGPGMRRFAWGFWFLLSALLVLFMFAEPVAYSSDLPAHVRSQFGSTVPCGPRGSLAVLLHGAQLPPSVPFRSIIASACEEEAQTMVLVSMLAIVSTAASAAVGIRAVRRRRVARETGS